MRQEPGPKVMDIVFVGVTRDQYILGSRRVSRPYLFGPVWNWTAFYHLLWTIKFLSYYSTPYNISKIFVQNANSEYIHSFKYYSLHYTLLFLICFCVTVMMKNLHKQSSYLLLIYIRYNLLKHALYSCIHTLLFLNIFIVAAIMKILCKQYINLIYILILYYFIQHTYYIIIILSIYLCFKTKCKELTLNTMFLIPISLIMFSTSHSNICKVNVCPQIILIFLSPVQHTTDKRLNLKCC